MNKINAFITLFQKGQEVSNAETWKNRQSIAASIVALLGALLVIAKAFGVDIQVDENTLVAVGSGVAAVYGLFNIVITTITSKKVGTAPKQQ